jgi:hypothetical protein
MWKSNCHSLDALAFVKYNPDELMQATLQFIDMPLCVLRLKAVILECIVNLLRRSLGKVFFFKLSGNDKFITSGNWFNDGE